MIALAMYSCLAGQDVPAQESGYSDDEVKAQFVEAGMFCHAEFIRRGYRRAFEMAGCDTNRYARILRELAVENTNETEWAIASLGKYKTPESLPFLYSYATNAVYGAKALKAVFAIEGVTSNSIPVVQGYLSLTNEAVIVERGGATVCAELIRRAKQIGVSVDCRTNALSIANTFATEVNRNYYWLDHLLLRDDDSYRYSKRRLRVLRNADLQRCPYPFQVNYVTNAINELVAYPEANLPD
jgi:hypothetical protein